MTQNDMKLLSQACRGDRHAYGQLVYAYQGLVFAVALNMTGNWHDSEDVMQEAFLRAWIGLQKLTDPTRFASWLCTITRRAALDLLKRKEKLAIIDIDAELARQIPSDTESPAETYARRQLNEILWEEVGALPACSREAILLFYIEGYSIARAADFLGISEAAFKMRLQYGRECLRDSLAQKLDATLRQRKPGRERTEMLVAALPAMTFFPVGKLTTFGGGAGKPAGLVGGVSAWLGTHVVVLMALLLLGAGMAFPIIKPHLRQSALRSKTITPITIIQPKLTFAEPPVAIDRPAPPRMAAQPASPLTSNTRLIAAVTPRPVAPDPTVGIKTVSVRGVNEAEDPVADTVSEKQEVIKLQYAGAKYVADSLSDRIYSEDPWTERDFWLRPGESHDLYAYHFDRAIIEPDLIGALSGGAAATFTVTRGAWSQTLTLHMSEAWDWDGLRIKATNIYAYRGPSYPGQVHLLVTNLKQEKRAAEIAADQGKLRGVRVAVQGGQNALALSYTNPASYKEIVAEIKKLDQPAPPKAVFSLETRLIQENTTRTLASRRPFDPVAELGMRLRQGTRMQWDDLFKPKLTPLQLPVLVAGGRTTAGEFEARLRAQEAVGRITVTPGRAEVALQNDEYHTGFEIYGQYARPIPKPEELPKAIYLTDVKDERLAVVVVRLTPDFGKDQASIRLKGSLEITDIRKLNAAEMEIVVMRNQRNGGLNVLRARKPSPDPREVKAYAEETRRILVDLEKKCCDLGEWMAFEIELQDGESVLLTGPEFGGRSVLVTMHLPK